MRVPAVAPRLSAAQPKAARPKAAQPKAARLKAAQPKAAQPKAAFGMEFASARRPVVRREEREARWRLELAETRAHPFHSTKVCFCPAALPA